MNRTSARLSVIVVVLLVSVQGLSNLAEARPLYKKVWEKVYPKVPTKDGKIDCGVCHPNKDKTILNHYGQALADELGEKKVTDEMKIAEAIRAIAQKKCESGNWDERLKQGKAPCEHPDASRPSHLERLLNRH